MSKSRASKTKAAGLAVGVDKYRKLYGNIPKEFNPFCGGYTKIKPNRMIRRMQRNG